MLFVVLDFYDAKVSKEGQDTSVGYRFRVLNNQDILSEKDLLLQEDVYVLYGRDEERIDSLSNLGQKTIGVLLQDSDEIIYYLKAYSALQYKAYDNSEQLFQDYESEQIDMIIIPNIMYLDKTILNTKYNIKYVFTEISKKIVLSLAENDNNKEMNNIVKKYFNSWKSRKLVEVYNTNLLNYYIKKSLNK